MINKEDCLRLIVKNLFAQKDSISSLIAAIENCIKNKGVEEKDYEKFIKHFRDLEYTVELSNYFLDSLNPEETSFSLWEGFNKAKDFYNKMRRKNKILLPIIRTKYSRILKELQEGTKEREEALEKHLKEIEEVIEALNIAVFDKMPQLIPFLIYDNAAKYSPQKEQVSTIVKTGDSQEIIIEVSNYGPCLTEEELRDKRYLDKGYRGENAQKHTDIGHGLGFNFISKICDQYGWQCIFEPQNDDKLPNINGIDYIKFVLRLTIPCNAVKKKSELNLGEMFFVMFQHEIINLQLPLANSIVLYDSIFCDFEQKGAKPTLEQAFSKRYPENKGNRDEITRLIEKLRITCYEYKTELYKLCLVTDPQKIAITDPQTLEIIEPYRRCVKKILLNDEVSDENNNLLTVTRAQQNFLRIGRRNKIKVLCDSSETISLYASEVVNSIPYLLCSYIKSLEVDPTDVHIEIDTYTDNHLISTLCTIDKHSGKRFITNESLVEKLNEINSDADISEIVQHVNNFHELNIVLIARLLQKAWGRNMPVRIDNNTMTIFYPYSTI